MDPLITLEPIRHVDVTNSTQNAPLVPQAAENNLANLFTAQTVSLDGGGLLLLAWCLLRLRLKLMQVYGAGLRIQFVFFFL